jgi:serine/threonine protein kinase
LNVIFIVAYIVAISEYLAPEVVFNSGHDQMVDIWAIGITVYEMLTSSTPFSSSSPSGIFRKLAKVKVNCLTMSATFAIFTINDFLQRDGVNFSPEVTSQVNNPVVWQFISNLLQPVPAEYVIALLM